MRGRFGRLAQFFVVEEEERTIVAVEAGEHDRTADVEARLVLKQFGLGQPIALVEVRVRVQRVAAVLVKDRAEELVRSRPRGVANLR